MIANYHTHTVRSRHAVGTDEEYVLAAIESGIKTLGFSDHGPYCFEGEYYSGFRMKREDIEDYAASVLLLKEKYKNEIDIHLGVELEYYPAHFAKTLDFLRKYNVEYMLLGQHFLGNEQNEHYNGNATENEVLLQRYCEQTMEAMDTGLFTYFAHPDLANYTGDAKIYRKHMRRLCRHARECGIPLEINMLGMQGGRNYPNKMFWQLAAEEGCSAVIGCDAHDPAMLKDTATERLARRLAAEAGVQILETVQLRNI